MGAGYMQVSSKGKSNLYVTKQPKVVKARVVEKKPKKRGKNIIDICKMGVLPKPRRKVMTLNFNEPFEIQTSNTNSATIYYRLESIYDPRFALGGNTCRYYEMLMGTVPGTYKKWRLNYVDVYIKAILITPNTLASMTVSTTNVGTADYPTGYTMEVYKNRENSITKSLEYLGDTKFAYFKFRVYPWKAHGMTKREYEDADNEFNYNKVDDLTNIYLAMTVGDSTSTLSSLNVNGNIFMRYNITATDLNLNHVS